MVKTPDPTQAFREMRKQSGHWNAAARECFDVIARHHALIGWSDAEIDELKTDLVEWWKADNDSAMAYLREAEHSCSAFLKKMADGARAAERRVCNERVHADQN